MEEALFGTDLKQLIKEAPEIYAEVMRKQIDDNLDSRPILTVDDPKSGKVLVISLKAYPDKGRSKGYSDSTLMANHRVMPFDNQNYFVIIGQESDLAYPMFTGVTPMAAVNNYIFNHKVKYKGICPPGDEVAKIMSECLATKIPDAYPHGTRPRSIEALLISNPYKKNRLPKEDCPDTRIYVLERSSDSDSLVVRGMTGNPAFYVSKKLLWDEYQRNLKLLRKDKQKKLKTRKRNDLLDLDDRIIASMAAIIATPLVTFTGPSVMDVVTVPFEKPKGNKSNARYDIEYLEPLYEKAAKLRMKTHDCH